VLIRPLPRISHRAGSERLRRIWLTEREWSLVDMMQRTVAGNANRDSAPVVFNGYREGDILPEIGISQIGTGDLVTVDQKLICEMPDLDPKPRSHEADTAVLFCGMPVKSRLHVVALRNDDGAEATPAGAQGIYRILHRLDLWPERTCWAIARRESARPP
jgi:hypothetical protein